MSLEATFRAADGWEDESGIFFSMKIRAWNESHVWIFMFLVFESSRFVSFWSPISLRQSPGQVTIPSASKLQLSAVHTCHKVLKKLWSNSNVHLIGTSKKLQQSDLHPCDRSWSLICTYIFDPSRWSYLDVPPVPHRPFRRPFVCSGFREKTHWQKWKAFRS